MRWIIPFLWLLSFSTLPASAQNVTNPADTAPAGAYNSSPPTCTAGQFCRMQTDVNGNLKTTFSAAAWTPKLLNGLSNTAVAIKASAGQLAKLYCYNPNSSVAYIQVYNVAAASVTVGTTTPLQSYGIPATQAAGFSLAFGGDTYTTAISAAATTAATNGTAPSTAVDCNVTYN